MQGIKIHFCEFLYALCAKRNKLLGLVIAFGYTGEILARLLPLKLPAGVLGIVLVFSLLSLGVVRPRHLGKTADFISANMAFFFLPLAVSVLQNYHDIRPVLAQLILICVLSTLVTFAVSYGTVRLLRILMGRGSLPPASSRLPGGAGPGGFRPPPPRGQKAGGTGAPAAPPQEAPTQQEEPPARTGAARA